MGPKRHWVPPPGGGYLCRTRIPRMWVSPAARIGRRFTVDGSGCTPVAPDAGPKTVIGFVGCNSTDPVNGLRLVPWIPFSGLAGESRQDAWSAPAKAILIPRLFPGQPTLTPPPPEPANNYSNNMRPKRFTYVRRQNRRASVDFNTSED